MGMKNSRVKDNGLAVLVHFASSVVSNHEHVQLCRRGEYLRINKRNHELSRMTFFEDKYRSADDQYRGTADIF